ncbi:BRO family protein [Streptomyces sp. ME01-24h]|nr:BRO family protein [Streptomyces sp. ME01-24h]
MTVDGEPWFVGRDACEALGIADARASLNLLDEDDRDSVPVTDSLGRQQPTIIINEPGLYSLILRSRRPEAKAFKRWITHDVIPSIRRTGSYTIRPAAPVLPDMATPEGRRAVARMLLESATREVELSARVAELEPKALIHDAFLSAQAGDRILRQAAKELGWRESDLRAFLIDEKFVYRRPRTCGGFEYDFYASHAEYFRAVEKVVEHTGGRCAHYTVYITPAGLMAIQRRISRRRGELEAAINSTPA